jgi:hypothetical protein
MLAAAKRMDMVMLAPVPECPTAPLEGPGSFVTYLELEVPSALAPVVRRHHGHLLALAESLRESGVDDEVIRRSVGGLVEAYRLELLAALEMNRGETLDG